MLMAEVLFGFELSMLRRLTGPRPVRRLPLGARGGPSMSGSVGVVTRRLDLRSQLRSSCLVSTLPSTSSVPRRKPA
jgi:hypothetical protein